MVKSNGQVIKSDDHVVKTLEKCILDFCTLSYLNDFLLRHNKTKYIIIAFSTLFLFISCQKCFKDILAM